MALNVSFEGTRVGLLDQAKKLAPEALWRLIRRMEDMRVEITTRITALPTGSSRVAQLAHMRREIERVMAEFSRDAGKDFGKEQAKVFDHGAERTADHNDPAPQPRPMLGRLSRTTLEQGEIYSLEDLPGISDEVTAKINERLRRALLGGQLRVETINDLGRLLSGSDTPPSMFSALGKRAASIYSDYMHVVSNMGSQARLEQFAERAKDRGDKEIPAKEWRHGAAPDRHPRPGHKAPPPDGLNGMVIPVGESFRDPKTGDVLRFPGDPRAPASATRGCKCILLPAHTSPRT